MKHLKHILIAVSAVACQAENSSEVTHNAAPQAADQAPGTPDTDAGETRLATFAGGCFWCMETPFEKIDGVSAVVSGYTGGEVDNPTYKEVCAGTTGHTEAVQIHYDPDRISYADLLEIFWRQIDPTDAGGQFVDRGTQYRSEIFYHDDAQRDAAEASKRALAASGRFDKPIVTAITPFERYWEAEEYHQDFYLKSPERYYSYRKGSGRDRFLDRTWGADREYVPKGAAATKANASAWRSYQKESDAELRERLTELQYRVTQREGTERPFKNEFWDNKKAGIYVDIVSGEPLFSSNDKFKSGTGWPSFTRPLVDANIATKTDHKIGYARTEVRSAIGNSHLGHVFEDGPAPTGLRYCINSAALRFVPESDLEREGYGEFAEALQP